MKSNFYKISFTTLFFTLIFLSASELTPAQRSRRRAPTQRRSVSTNTNLTNDQALRIAAILQGVTASFAPGEQPAQEKLNTIARTQLNDILDVLTPAQKRQIGYSVQIVDPESGIDYVAKIPCINPAFVNALRQEMRYLLAGDPESVQKAAVVLHPNDNPREYITVLNPQCVNSNNTEAIPRSESRTGAGRKIYSVTCLVEGSGAELEIVDENHLCLGGLQSDGICFEGNVYVKTGPGTYSQHFEDQDAYGYKRHRDASFEFQNGNVIWRFDDDQGVEARTQFTRFCRYRIRSCLNNCF